MEDERFAVLAHGLLNSMSIVLGSLASARRFLAQDAPEDVRGLLDAADRHGRDILVALRELALGRGDGIDLETHGTTAPNQA